MLSSRLAKGTLLVTVPSIGGYLYATRDVYSLKVQLQEGIEDGEGVYKDMYEYKVPEDDACIIRATQIKKQRFLLDMYTSAFYTSPVFFPEKVVSSMYLGKWESMGELKERAWDVSDSVVFFEVTERQRDKKLTLTALEDFDSHLEVIEKRGKRGGMYLRFGSTARNTSSYDPWMSLTEPLHVAYSRLLLRAAAWKLVRDSGGADEIRKESVQEETKSNVVAH